MTSTTWSATAPPARPALQRIAVRALRVAAIGALVGVALALVGRVAPASALAHSLAIALACWALIDGGRALFVQALRRRHPAHGMWPGWGPMSACIVLGAPVGALLGSAVGDWLSGTTTPPPADARAVASLLVLSVLPGFALTGYFRLRGRVADAQAQAAAAARVAAEQQLRLLQSQLEPHMLFNTLANLRVLIGLDAARAQAMLDRLIAFLRATLEASRAGSHPLAAEFARLADYLALMQVRMGPRLATRFELPGDLAAVPVPPLLLQPLVENAVKHGLEPKVEGGTVEVGARRDGDRLVLWVRDDGVGLGAPGADGTRFGLAQVRERLAALYGDAARFELADADGGGAVATLTLPLIP